MTDKTYYEKQADLCVRMALASSDPVISERFSLMAAEYRAKAGSAPDADTLPDYPLPTSEPAEGEQGYD
jgi:hypothetical protein